MVGDQLRLISMEGEALVTWFQWQYKDSTLAVGINLTQNGIVHQTSEGSCKISISLVSSKPRCMWCHPDPTPERSIPIRNLWSSCIRAPTWWTTGNFQHVGSAWKTFTYVERPWMLLDGMSMPQQRHRHTEGTVILNPDRRSSPLC